MSDHKISNDALIERLNQALAWELRAMLLYAHFADYVAGIHRLQLTSYFAGEAAESLDHASTVRSAIVSLGGVAVTDRDPTPIPHTTEYRTMLEESIKVERKAAQTYADILEQLDDNSELYDNLQQVYFAEERSVIELEQLLGG